MRRGKSDATARGAFMVAAAEMGVYRSVEEAFRMLKKNSEERIYVPSEAYTGLYREAREQMNQMYRQIYSR